MNKSNAPNKDFEEIKKYIDSLKGVYKPHLATEPRPPRLVKLFHKLTNFYK